MALELFKPFIIRELIKEEKVTLKAARKMLERGAAGVWNILERVTKNHPIMLNRAPTLHRLGIQAFEPVLVEGKSIRCTRLPAPLSTRTSTATRWLCTFLFPQRRSWKQGCL
jgi:DNA-directed RNA polymerase beta' subunit